MTILGIAGASIVTLAVDSGRLVRHAQESETDLRRADGLLTSVSLWSREDLDRHLGDRAQGAWTMTVTLASPVLYAVTLRDSATMSPFLATVLYRPSVIDQLGGNATP